MSRRPSGGEPRPSGRGKSTKRTLWQLQRFDYTLKYDYGSGRNVRQWDKDSKESNCISAAAALYLPGVFDYDQKSVVI